MNLQEKIEANRTREADKAAKAKAFRATILGEQDEACFAIVRETGLPHVSSDGTVYLITKGD